MQSNKQVIQVSFQEIFHKLEQNRVKLSKYPAFYIDPAGFQQLFANASEIPFNVFIEGFINDGDVQNECFDEYGTKLLDALAQNRRIKFSDGERTFQEFLDKILSELSKEENQDKCTNIRSACNTIVDIFPELSRDPIEELKNYYGEVSNLLVYNNPCSNLADELENIIKTAKDTIERSDRQSIIDLYRIFAYTYQNENIADIERQLKTTVEKLAKHSSNSIQYVLFQPFFESLKKVGLYQDNSSSSIQAQLNKLKQKYNDQQITQSKRPNDIMFALQALIRSDSILVANKIFDRDTVETLKKLLDQLKSQAPCNDIEKQFIENQLKTTAKTLKKHSDHSMVGHLVKSFCKSLEKQGLYQDKNLDIEQAENTSYYNGSKLMRGLGSNSKSGRELIDAETYQIRMVAERAIMLKQQNKAEYQKDNNAKRKNIISALQDLSDKGFAEDKVVFKNLITTISTEDNIGVIQKAIEEQIQVLDKNVKHVNMFETFKPIVSNLLKSLSAQFPSSKGIQQLYQECCQNISQGITRVPDNNIQLLARDGVGRNDADTPMSKSLTAIVKPQQNKNSDTQKYDKDTHQLIRPPGPNGESRFCGFDAKPEYQKDNADNSRSNQNSGTQSWAGQVTRKKEEAKNKQQNKNSDTQITRGGMSKF